MTFTNVRMTPKIRGNPEYGRLMLFVPTRIQTDTHVTVSPLVDRQKRQAEDAHAIPPVTPLYDDACRCVTKKSSVRSTREKANRGGGAIILRPRAKSQSMYEKK